MRSHALFLLLCLAAALTGRGAWAGISLNFDDKSAKTPELDIKKETAGIGKSGRPMSGPAQGPAIYYLDEIPNSWAATGAQITGRIGALAVDEQTRRELLAKGVKAAESMTAPCILIQKSYWAGLDAVGQEAVLVHEKAHLFDFSEMRTLPEKQKSAWFKAIYDNLKLDLHAPVKEEIRSDYAVYRRYIEKKKALTVAAFIAQNSLGADYYDEALGGIDKSMTLGAAIELFKAQDRRKEYRFWTNELDRDYEFSRVLGLQEGLAPYLAHSELFARYEEAKVYRKNGVSFEDWANTLKIRFPPGSDGEIVYGYILKQMRKLWDAADRNDLMSLYKKEAGR